MNTQFWNGMMVGIFIASGCFSLSQLWFVVVIRHLEKLRKPISHDGEEAHNREEDRENPFTWEEVSPSFYNVVEQ